jgi:hypothetical protein
MSEHTEQQVTPPLDKGSVGGGVKAQEEETPQQASDEASAGSNFAQSKVEMTLQLLQADGHPAGRKIMTTISVNEKPLRIVSLRMSQVELLLQHLQGLSAEQLLNVVEEQLAQWQAQASSIEKLIAKPRPKPATQRARPRRRSGTSSEQPELGAPTATPPTQSTAQQPARAKPLVETNTSKDQEGTSTGEKPAQLPLF